MAKGDTFSLMADEIIRDISEKGVSFHRAFAWAAHRRHLYHHLERSRYNAWFSLVRTRVSKREKKLLKRSLEGERPWQHGKKPTQNSSLPVAVDDSDYSDPWDNEPLQPEDFEDNIGFIHIPTAPYPLPAYEADT